MPIKPSEVGSAIDFSTAKAFMDKVDAELRKESPKTIRRNRFSTPFPEWMNVAVMDFVVSEYQNAGWLAKRESGSDYREEWNNLVLSIKKTDTVSTALDYRHD